MPTKEIAVNMIKSNPWQPRLNIDPASIAELVESITSQGLLQPPVARAVDGHYELAFGHRRLLAWQRAMPGKPMPLQIADLTDRQMAEQAAIENSARQDLNPVERAAAIKRLCEEFKLSQVEAGKLFGLTSQGAVSNAVRLLQLPERIKVYVASGELPERLARQLVIIARHLPKVAETVADKTAKSDKKEKIFDNELDHQLNTHGRRFYQNKFDTDKTMMVTEATQKWAAKLGIDGKAPACKGCEFCIGDRYGRHCCVRPGCWDLKQHIAYEMEIAKVARKLGVQVAVQNEAFEVIFDGKEEDLAWAKALLKAKTPSLCLRLDSAENIGWMTEQNRRALLGYTRAVLGSTQTTAALKKIVPVPAASAKKKTSRSDYDKHWAEQSRKRKVKESYFREAAPAFARLLPKNKTVLDLLWYGMEALGKPPETLSGKQMAIVQQCLENKLTDDGVEWNAEPNETAQGLLEVAKQFKVKLPPTIAAAAKPPEPKPAAKKAK